MYNFFEKVKSQPYHFKQLSIDELLITQFNCPLENRFEDMWSHYNYFVYVLEGKKVWHTADGAHELFPGDCVLVQRGACIVEQFLDTAFCVVVFFVPDEFICDVLRSKASSLTKMKKPAAPVMRIKTDEKLTAFFQSMLPYFSKNQQPDKSLLELKFRELILNVASNPENKEILAYFCSLVHEPNNISLSRVMEDNFMYNLSLDEYARLSKRSLSGFKRDFQKIYKTTPGKWLAKKRLAHAKMLLTKSDKSVSEVAFESGFENLSHFSRAFRQQYGRPPAAYREQKAA